MEAPTLDNCKQQSVELMMQSPTLARQTNTKSDSDTASKVLVFTFTYTFTAEAVTLHGQVCVFEQVNS